MVNNSLLKTHRKSPIRRFYSGCSIRDAGDRREKGKSLKVKGKGQIHLSFIPNPLKTSRLRAFVATLKKQTQSCSLVFILRRAQDVVRGYLESVQNCSKIAKKCQKHSKLLKSFVGLLIMTSKIHKKSVFAFIQGPSHPLGMRLPPTLKKQSQFPPKVVEQEFGMVQ